MTRPPVQLSIDDLDRPVRVDRGRDGSWIPYCTACDARLGVGQAEPEQALEIGQDRVHDHVCVDGTVDWPDGF